MAFFSCVTAKSFMFTCIEKYVIITYAALCLQIVYLKGDSYVYAEEYDER